MSAADMRREQQKKPNGAGDGLEKEVGVDDGEGRIEEPIATKKKKLKKKEFTKEAKAAAGAGVKKDSKNRSENDRYSAPGDGEEVEAEAEDDGEAEEIELNSFDFSTHLTASPQVISGEQRADQRARLAARIEALRAKRRADSPDGTPARNRHELMAARRREEAVHRKERKKEIRLHHKAVTEQVKDAAPLPKKGPTPKKNEKDSQSQVSGGGNVSKDKHISNVNPPPNHKYGGKGGKGGPKKSNSKKSRPGFEGSLKSSKGKR